MKYLVNNTAITYKFINGLMLTKQSAMAIDDDKLAELKKDFQFASLTTNKLVEVTENKPASLSSAAEQLAEKEAEIKKLKEELSKANSQLEYAEASGKEVDETIDTATDSVEEVKTTKKRTSKK